MTTRQGNIHMYEHICHGQDNQTLEVTLDPGQSIHTENGAMSFMGKNVRMTTGTGRRRGPWALFKRKLSGENLLINIFKNEGENPEKLGISPEHPAHIMAIELDAGRPDIICQKETYLAGHPDVRVSVSVVSLKATFFGNGNLIMQRLHGLGEVFLAGNGNIVEKNLEPGETYLTESKAILAYEESVEYSADLPEGISNMFWGKEKLFLLSLRGPGTVWFQSTSRWQKHQPIRVEPDNRHGRR